MTFSFMTLSLFEGQQHYSHLYQMLVDSLEQMELMRLAW
jgi:hypothetical protein